MYIKELFSFLNKISILASLLVKVGMSFLLYIILYTLMDMLK